MTTGKKAVGVVAGALAVAALAGGTATYVSNNNTSTVVESPLSNELAATPSATPPVPAKTPGPVLETFQRFVGDMQSSGPYKNWAAANCGAANGGTPVAPKSGTEVARWIAFRNAVLAGKRPAIPANMTTFFGRGLVDAGWIVLTA